MKSNLLKLPRRRIDLTRMLGWSDPQLCANFWLWLADLSEPCSFLLPSLLNDQPAVLCVFIPQQSLVQLQKVAESGSLVAERSSSSRTRAVLQFSGAPHRVLVSLEPLADKFGSADGRPQPEALPVWLISRQGMSLRMVAAAPLRLDELTQTSKYDQLTLPYEHTCRYERVEGDTRWAQHHHLYEEISELAADERKGARVWEFRQRWRHLTLRQDSLQMVALRQRWLGARTHNVQEQLTKLGGPALVMMGRPQHLQRRGWQYLFWLPGQSDAELRELAMLESSLLNVESSDQRWLRTFVTLNREGLEIRAPLAELPNWSGGIDDRRCWQRDWVFASEHGCWHAHHSMTFSEVDGEQLSEQIYDFSVCNWNPLEAYSAEELDAAAGRPEVPEPHVLTLPVYWDDWRQF